ncbi:MAG: bifunctional DNA-formamidopyrimidine glycosylase/DNA-(apurinic or apyrimidinic site) lyase [Patescibacteria group bacterium]|nr:bifunctional DNA-formamidopyrimidine glycosylase/DNA-(apurinic or apyrimidinic site) lyase [Patescibacteria group bacterium]
MPELPEVETIRRQLDDALAGMRIESVELLKSGREEPVGKEFVACLTGKKIKNIERRAKLIVWRFVDGSVMFTHLKMTGRLVLEDKRYKPRKHDRAVFKLKGKKGGKDLVWSDVRQFGFMKCLSAEDAKKVLDAYGPEPLEISAQELADRLLKPKTRKIKVALMDQATIAGIGNIYADEALFRAGVRPTRPLGELTAKERLEIAQQVQALLKLSIKHRGTSANDYVDASGKQGKFLKLLQVYGRGGEECVKCGTPIKRIVIGQRGTHYCPKCQK